MAFKIAVIEGEGIGGEVGPEGARVVEAAARRFGCHIAWERLDWGCDRHVRFGRAMAPASGENLTRDTGGAAPTGALGMAIADRESAPPRRGAAAYG